MSCPKNIEGFGPSPIPEEAKWIQLKDISQVSGFSHGCGKCAPQQGACKLTLNVKNGIIKEALVETIGCSGSGHYRYLSGIQCIAERYQVVCAKLCKGSKCK